MSAKVGDGASRRAALVGGACVAAVLGVAYGATLHPAVADGDPAELLDICHPPGYELLAGPRAR